MKPAVRFAVTTLTILLITVGHQQTSHAADFDHSKFDKILKAYVDPEGRVDYNGIAVDDTFHEYITSLKNAKADSLSRDGQFAFWINAYNAVTIDKVIKWKPKKSVRETFVPGVWTGTKFFTSRQHTVAGQSLSQDDIEHEILRKRFKDPRIHFALNCASHSCPPIRIYTPGIINSQLDLAAKNFINNETIVDMQTGIVNTSKIFQWLTLVFPFANCQMYLSKLPNSFCTSRNF